MKSSDVSLFGCIDTIYESDIDDDNCSGAETSVVLERRRKSHTEAEQRRRNAIKRGFENLRELVYPSKSNGSSARLSKLLILNKSVSEIRKLVKEANQKEVDVSTLERTAETLRITTAFYGNRVQCASSIWTSVTEPVGEEPKFRIFELLSDRLFSSFNSAVCVSSFQQFTESYLNWLEEICSNEMLYGLIESILPAVLPLEQDASRNTVDNGCLIDALPVRHRSTKINSQKLFVTPNHADWPISDPCTSVQDTLPFPDVPSNHFLYDMKQKSMQRVPSHAFSNQRIRSCENSTSETVSPSCNLTILTTPPSPTSRESAFRSNPFCIKDTGEFSVSNTSSSSIPLAKCTQTAELVNSNNQNSYSSAISTDVRGEIPTPLLLPGSNFTGHSHRALFKPFR